MTSATNPDALLAELYRLRQARELMREIANELPPGHPARTHDPPR
ncbi:hypothetical protein [Acidiphilium sp.]|nr:hypothetical protein [Acidiphilium sp.]